MSRHAAGRVLLAVSLLLGALAFLPVSGGPADADGWAFSKTVRVDREHVDEDGTTAVAGSTYDVTVKVSRTKDLRGRQEVRVAWSGARPTGGVVLDGTSVEAKDQEFPVVVLQCRGVDTSRTPPSGQERLSPETCWTQTSTERYLASSSQTPAWRVDADETDEHRAAIVGAPSPLPRECSGLSVPVTARWLPLRAADGTVYPGGPDPAVGCVASAPESNDVGDVGLPSNTVYGRTGTDGRGEVEFPLWTRSENATLGCSATVACSLVVVPVAGLSCDAWGHRLDAPQLQSSDAPLTEAQKRSADASCRKDGSYAPGEPRDATHGTDPEARVWIDGTPDPWGMQVNREYRGVRLASLDDFLRDRYEAPDWYKAANKCYGNSPSPYLNLVANPQPNLGAVTFNLQYASSAVLTACNFLTEDPLGSLPLRKEGREPVGKRFVIGLVSLASADRYNLRTADLQTSSSVPRGSVFTSPQGRTFVRASSASLAAATSALVPDERTRTWSVDQARLRRAGAAAYPGVMPVYLAAPVKGLTTTAAQQLADLLCYAVDPRRGLRTGTANGQLPPGYLGLSAANGLRAQRSYTLSAVSAVRNQSGSVPALDVAAPSYDAVCDPAVRPTDAGAGGSSSGAGTDGFAAGGGAPVAPDDAEAPRAAAAPTSAPVDVVLTAGQSSRVGALGAPLLLALALGAGLGGSLLRWPHHVRTALREARTLWPDAGGRHREP